MYKCDVYKKYYYILLYITKHVISVIMVSNNVSSLATGKRPVKQNIAENSPNLFDSWIILSRAVTLRLRGARLSIRRLWSSADFERNLHSLLRILFKSFGDDTSLQLLKEFKFSNWEFLWRSYVFEFQNNVYLIIMRLN